MAIANPSLWAVPKPPNRPDWMRPTLRGLDARKRLRFIKPTLRGLDGRQPIEFASDEGASLSTMTSVPALDYGQGGGLGFALQEAHYGDAI